MIEWLLHPDLGPLLERGTPIFLIVICAVLFAECGLLVGFFLPGDSLLFSLGLVVATVPEAPSLAVVLPLCFVAAAAGDQVGYMVGARIGPSLFTRPDSRLFKQENVVRTKEFFDKHGARALILARFVPVVRTFTPVLAGVSQLPYRRFVTYNLIGAALWACGATLVGWGLGKRFPDLDRYLTPILLVVVALSMLPVVLEIRKARRLKQPIG